MFMVVGFGKLWFWLVIHVSVGLWVMNIREVLDVFIKKF